MLSAHACLHRRLKPSELSCAGPLQHDQITTMLLKPLKAGHMLLCRYFPSTTGLGKQNLRMLRVMSTTLLSTDSAQSDGSF